MQIKLKIIGWKSRSLALNALNFFLPNMHFSRFCNIAFLLKAAPVKIIAFSWPLSRLINDGVTFLAIGTSKMIRP